MIKQIRHHIVAVAGGGGLRAELVRGGIGSGIVKAASLGATLAVALVLARSLGPDGYGVYSYVLAIAGLLSIVAQTGLPQLALRETAHAYASADWHGIVGVWRWSGAVGALGSLFAVGICAVSAWLLAEHFSSIQLQTLAAGLAVIPGLVFARTVGGALRGLGHLVAGQLPDLVLRPLLLLVLVIGILAGVGTESLGPATAMACHALAAGLAVLTGLGMWYRWRPPALSEAYPRFRHSAWGRAIVPLGLTTAMMLITRQTDILLLGVFVDASNVGIYRIAVQGSQLAGFGLQAVNMVVGPQAVQLHKQADLRRLQRLAVIAARAALAIALPLTLVYLVFGDALLSAAVGAEYTAAAGALALLAGGHVVNAGMGSVGELLNMTGHEKIVSWTLFAATALNILCNMALIPLFGINGAAAATALTLVVWNSLLAWQVRRHLNINCTCFGSTR